MNCINNTYQTPLFVAAAYNQVEIIDYLLQKGAKIETKDRDNFTPLLMAASEGNADAVRLLMDNNADLYALDKEDKTALYWAAAQNNIEVAQVGKKTKNGLEVNNFLRNYDVKYVYG